MKDEKQRRDKNFRKLCRWMHEAGEIAEILKEECKNIQRGDSQGWGDADLNAKGVHNALEMLYFMSSLADFPQDYLDSDPADEQRNMYPEIAYGMMYLAFATGQMRENDNSSNGWGY